MTSRTRYPVFIALAALFMTLAGFQSQVSAQCRFNGCSPCARTSCPAPAPVVCTQQVSCPAPCPAPRPVVCAQPVSCPMPCPAPRPVMITRCVTCPQVTTVSCVSTLPACCPSPCAKEAETETPVIETEKTPETPVIDIEVVPEPQPEVTPEPAPEPLPPVRPSRIKS